MRLDHATQRLPWNNALNPVQEHVAPRGLALLLVLRFLVGGHGKGLLRHARKAAGCVLESNVISVAIL